jgi:hypothetical protein
MPKKLNIKVDIKAEELRKKLNIKNGVDGKDGKDGKDAVVDVENIALEASTIALEKIKPSIPTIEQIELDIPKLGQPIRDSLELLQGNERLNIDAIKGLEDYDEISKLARQPKEVKNYYSGGGSSGGIQSVVAGTNVSVDSTDPQNPIVSSLSDRYKTTSTTSHTIVPTGTLSFTVDAGLAYTILQDVSIVYDASNHMHGQVNSYSGTTLVVDIQHKTGSGTYASWTINLDGIAPTTPTLQEVTNAGATTTNDISVPDEAYGAGWNGSMEVPTKNALYDKIETLSGGIDGTLTATRIPFALDSNTLEDDPNLVFDKANDRLGVQATSPQAPVHAVSSTGSTIAEVTSASTVQSAESIATVSGGTATAIAEPSAGSGGSISFVNGGSGTAITATGNTYYFRIHPCIYVPSVSTYYKSQYYEEISLIDPNDSLTYDIQVSWGSVSISGETPQYFVEYSTDGSSFNPLNVYPTLTETFTNMSGSDPTTSWGTFYTNSVTAPTAFSGGSAQATNVGSGGLTEVSTTILLEVDSVKTISGTDYVSGSPTTGSFDDTGLGTYDAEISWTDNGNATNAIVRISQDGGSTWYYQYVGNTTGPYTFTSLSNDTSAEARWGQTYSGTGTTYNFSIYAQGLSPSGVTVYGATPTTYSVNITTSDYYIIKHTWSGSIGAKIIETNTSTYGQTIGSYVFYDIGYTSWISGTTVTPNSYGWTGSNQVRYYKIFNFDAGLGIYSPSGVVTSSSNTGGTKYNTVSWTGSSRVRVLRSSDGVTYSQFLDFTSVTSFDDDSLRTWSSGNTVTPNAIVPTASRFDKANTSVTDIPIVSVINTASTGTRFSDIGFGVATSSTVGATYQGRLGVEISTGSLIYTGARIEIRPSSLSATPTTILGNTNVFNNTNSSTCHFIVKGISDSTLINTRSDMDTVGFGQSIGIDHATTVQIHPARATDAGLVMIGHSSHSDSSTLVRFQTNAGSYTGEITVGGWWRGSTGAVGTPSLSCRSDTNTGIYFPSADILAITTGGTERARFDSSGRFGVGNTTLTAFIDAPASTTSIASFRLRSGTSPSSPNDGDIWNDSTQKEISVRVNGVTQVMDTTLFTQTATVTVTNTTTETTVTSTGVGTLTLPANFFVAGKTIQIAGFGIVSSASNPNMRIRIKLGSTTILDTGNVPSGNVTNASFIVDGIITCRTTGSSGTLMAQGYYEEVQGSGAKGSMANTTTTTINTTTSQALTITAQWSSASTSNTISLTNLLLKVLN